VEDFESYIHGQVVDDDKTFPADTETIIHGIINNGLNIIELPAVGAFAANDSAASEVGTGDILADDDDASYITSADGDLGYTVGLPPLVGYVEGAALELHIRASISGGVNPDDPDTLDADMQVHISTDDTGDTTIGGFSDGTDEGMGFSLTVVDGTPVDYVVPLYMESWVDSPLQDVVDALTEGAYLNVVGATNNNTDTTPEVRVYEMSVVMLDDTDGGRFLRPKPDDDSCFVEQNVYSTGTTPLVSSLSAYVDFKLLPIVFNSENDGWNQRVLEFAGSTTDRPEGIEFYVDSGVPKLRWHDIDSVETIVDTAKTSVWYTAQGDWTGDGYRLRVYERDNVEVLIMDVSTVPTDSPFAGVQSQTGFVGDGTTTFEVNVDNAILQIHCHDELPIDPEPDWTCFDLSTAVFFSSTEDGEMDGQYNSGTGRIQSKLDSSSTVRSAEFHMPGFVLDPAKTYEIRATYADTTFGFGIYQQNPGWESTFWSDNYDLASMFDFGGRTVFIATVGPGIEEWDNAITAGYQTLIRFDTATNGEDATVGGSDLVSLCYREV
jgi:hypothetical protein